MERKPKNHFRSFIFLFFITYLIIINSCKSEIVVNTDQYTFNSSNYLNIKNYNEIKKKLIDQTISEMSLKEKLSQMLLISVDGTSYNETFSMYTGEYSPGGFLLFKYNVDSDNYKDIKVFTDKLKNEYTRLNQVSPYVAIDHEGGDVNRLKKVMPNLPSQKYIAEHYSASDAGEIYYLHSKMLEKLGINVNLAPVNEIETEENHEFLVNRSFGNIKNVYEYGNNALFNIDRTNVLAVQKHFPGNTNEDTHTGKAVIDSDLKTINDLYIAPFKNVRNINDTAVMMSHTILEKIDSKPSCISTYTINLFKDSTGFEGLLFTDDLTMEALEKSGFPMRKAIVEAVRAGVDVIMLSITNYIRIVDSIIDEIEKDNVLVENINRAAGRILNWKIDCGLVDIDLFSEEPALLFDKEFSYSEDSEKNFYDYYAQAEKLLKEAWIR